MEIQNTTLCYNCSTTIQDRQNLFFCPKCLIQLKCKECGEYAEKDAVGCFSCGSPFSVKKTSNEAVNKIEFEQKGDNKKFVASFTDHIGENLVASLSGLFLGTNYKPVANPFLQTRQGQIAAPASKQRSGVEDAIILESTDDELSEALTRIFRIDENKLTLINQRVKQTGKRDGAIRLSLLLLYAYSLTNQTQIKRNIIFDTLQPAKIIDNNFVYWLSRCDEINKCENDMLELTLPGKEAVLKILKEFVNPEIEKGSVQFSALSNKASRSRSKKAKTDGNSDNVESVVTSKSTTSKSKMSPAKMIDILITEKYFTEKRRVPEILKYCKDIKGQSLETNRLSVALLRKVKSQTLKREVNPSDNQYEYYK